MRIDALLNPRSIAILGASEKPTLGRRLLESLQKLGFDGDVYPINPNYTNILGRPCYASLNELPALPDVVAFCIGYRNILPNFRELASAGVKSAVIYDGGFAESGAEGRALQAEITRLAEDAGIALCGPNCMGVLNPHGRSTTYMTDVRDPSRLKGNVGFVSQSGSVCGALLIDVRRFGFSLVVSSGNEAVLDVSAYLDYFVDDPRTRVIAAFIESVREPEKFVAVLDRAASVGKPVVVLKAGKTERARRAIVGHTGALAGESRIFSEVLRAHRAIEVSDFDELAEILAVCQGRRWPTDSNIHVITASGGLAEVILDIATVERLPLPALSPDTRDAMKAIIGDVSGDGNPLDAWGHGNFRENLPHVLRTLDASSSSSAIVLCNDSCDGQPLERAGNTLENARILAEASGQSAKPHYLMTTRPGIMNCEQVDFLAAFGVPVIGGTRQGLGAIAKLAQWQRPMRDFAPRRQPPRIEAGRGRTLHEFDAKRLLSAAGVPTTRERLVRSMPEALKAADELGYPVALKVAAESVAHKTELGFLELDLSDARAVQEAYQKLSDRVAQHAVPIDGYIVQEMIAAGVEVFAGIKRDSQFGLALVFGHGGVAIEAMQDFAIRQLPLRCGDAESMVAETRVAHLLGSLRGKPPADVESLCSCLNALADFAVFNAAHIDEMDVNPIKVRPVGNGCIVVDALIVTRNLQTAPET